MTLALTPGEPAGIGADLCLQLARDGFGGPVVVIADPDLLRDRTRRLGLAVDVLEVDAVPTDASPAGQCRVLPVPAATPVSPGRPDPANAGYVLDTLRRAADGCLHGDFTAMVTGPVNKAVINAGGMPFTGHTEFLAGITGGDPVMLLVCPGLRVALATTHIPLHAVPAAITPERLRTVIGVLHRDLQARFALPRPRILVCGLNPHAGEDGHLGTEERDVIAPVLDEMRAHGIDLTGPLPADTLFTPQHLDAADAVLAMYHDQGLPVLKHRGFGEAVNVTLGLPIVRTSVDHGTAFELAGSGRADAGSLKAAVELALQLARERQ